MSVKILTTDDLMEFKMELLEEIQDLLKDQKPRMAKRWLKSADVIDQLKISPGTLQNLRVNGTLPYTKIGGLIFYDAMEIEEVLEKNKANNQNWVS